MKTILVCLSIILCNVLLIQQSDAQSFRQGATWYYDVPSGLFRFYADKDTLIAGTTCTRIRCEARVDPASTRFELSGLGDFYLRDQGDTIFAYNNLFGKFTPLYIFNVSDGDTLRLPAYRYHPCGSPIPAFTSDSTFRFVVDSVRMVRWDTSLLKTVYGHGIRRDTTVMSWVAGAGTIHADKQSIYVQHLGSIYSTLLPECNSCAHHLDGSCGWANKLLCYSDRSLNVKLTSGPCDKGIPQPTSIDPDPEQTLAVSIFPNPAEDYISVTMVSGLKTNISITDIPGKEVIRRELSPSGNTRIDISGLSQGTYIARIVTADGNSWFGKISVIR